MSLSWFPFSFFLREKITSPRNSTWCLQNTTFWDNFLIFRAESMFCSVLVCNVKWIDLWKIEPQIFSALEIVPRPKLGERFRKYSRAFQPLCWRSLCLREFKRDSSPNNILLCHVKTSLDNWQPLRRDISKLPFSKTAELFGEFADLKKCLEFADWRKRQSKGKCALFLKICLNGGRIYQFPKSDTKSRRDKWPLPLVLPGNLGKSICLKSAIRNHEKQKIKGK